MRHAESASVMASDSPSKPSPIVIKHNGTIIFLVLSGTKKKVLAHDIRLATL